MTSYFPLLFGFSFTQEPDTVKGHNLAVIGHPVDIQPSFSYYSCIGKAIYYHT
jgi:hypothetical protein